MTRAANAKKRKATEPVSSDGHGEDCAGGDRNSF